MGHRMGLNFGGGFYAEGHEGGDAVGDCDFLRGELHLRGFEAVAFGGDGDGAGGEGGADGDAVDAEFGGEVKVVGGVGDTAVVALSLIHI